MRQIRVLVASAARQLTWGSIAAAREMRAWRARAAAIPDAPTRKDALAALTHKRSHSDGAVLFTIIPDARHANLLRLLVAYEIMCDFLDSASERGAIAGLANGRQLHLALLDAFDPSRRLSDYYAHHPWRDDGGYLCALVAACREGCTMLASYDRVQPFVVREMIRANVLAINHDLDPAARDAGLHEWAIRERGGSTEVTWFEDTGAASATLTTHALLALAVEPRCDEEVIQRAYRAYSPWINLATTMLDSYVDQPEDSVNGDHSYVGHYPNSEMATKRIGRLIRRSLQEALALPNGERHAVIVACMVAMYLSKDSARTAQLRDGTANLVHAGGSLTRMLVPILRLWRIAYSQSSS